MAIKADTVTIVLAGEVPLKDFAKAIHQFHNLIKALSQESGSEGVDWVIDQLDISSAIATAKGIGEQERVEKVVRAYAEVGTALEQNFPIQYSKPVQNAARQLRQIINGRVQSIRFETPEREAIIRHRKTPRKIKHIPTQEMPTAIPIGPPTTTIGAIEGRIQTLTNRGGLRFTLYDLLNDKAVNCYITEGREDIMRDAWGKLATVSGIVTRDPLTGRPLAIRDVTEVEVLAQDFGDYRDARGISPPITDLLPEDAIRRLRDA